MIEYSKINCGSQPVEGAYMPRTRLYDLELVDTIYFS